MKRMKQAKTMKNLICILVVTFYSLLSTFNSVAQGVGINSTGIAPDNSAILDLNSTDKGFLITRVDTVNISSPAFGLMTLAPADSCLYLFNGLNWIGMGGGGSNCSCNCNTSSGGTSPNPTCDPDNETKVVDVINPATGKTWMDRNLGASQKATSSKDAAAYGNLYQWGRCIDGHEKRTSTTTTTLSTTNIAGHDNFIISPTGDYDWRIPQNDNLWQGVNGINNPCPKGYRLPTGVELGAELLSWSSDNAAGAFASPLKLPVGGFRFFNNGTFYFVGANGNYWTSTVDGIESQILNYNSTSASMFAFHRASAYSVRCIKD